MMTLIRNIPSLIPITKHLRNIIKIFKIIKNMKMGTLEDQQHSLDLKHKETKSQPLLRKKK